MDVITGSTFTSFAEMDAESLRAVFAKPSDMAIMVGQDGSILDVFGNPDLLNSVNTEAWIGQHLADAFSTQDGEKLHELITSRDGNCRIVHTTTTGDVAVINYTAMALGYSDVSILVGRDDTRIINMQHRLLDQQQLLGDKLESQKQVEAQYRTLFAIGAQPVILVSAGGRIVDINRAGSKVLRVESASVIGRKLSKSFAKSNRAELKTLLATVSTTSKPAKARFELNTGSTVEVSATPSLGSKSTLLVQVSQVSSQSDQIDPSQKDIFELVQVASEAVVVTDDDSAILWRNAAFDDLVMPERAEETAGQNLKRYFDISDLDLDIVLASLKKHRRIRMMPATMRRATGERIEVELSIAMIASVGTTRIGFFIRSIPGRALAPNHKSNGASDVAWEQIGKATLRELVRKEVDAVERKLIRSALSLTDNNRAATARLLGLSRQGLYCKLSRYGLEPE